MRLGWRAFLPGVQVMVWPTGLPKCPVSPEDRGEVVESVSDRFVEWVEQYARKVCPDGCLPTPGQEREISLFAEVTRVLRAGEPLAVSRPKCESTALDW